MPQNVTTRTVEPDILVVELSGRVTFGRETSQIEEMVVKAINDGVRKVMLDMSHVTYIDSAGIGIIALCFGKMTKLGGRFCVAGTAGTVREVFHMTHLDSVIPFADTADLACAGMLEAV